MKIGIFQDLKKSQLIYCFFFNNFQFHLNDLIIKKAKFQFKLKSFNSNLNLKKIKKETKQNTK